MNLFLDSSVYERIGLLCFGTGVMILVISMFYCLGTELLLENGVCD